MRRLLRPLPLLLLLLLTLLAGAAWLFATESGLRFAWRQVTDLAGGQLTATSLQGRLIGPLSVQGLRIDTDAASIAVERLSLDWEPSELPFATVSFDRLTASGVRVRLNESREEPSSPPAFEGVHLPLALALRNTRVEGLRIERPDAALIEVNAIALHGRAGPDALRLRTLDVTGPWGEFHLAGRVGLQPDATVDARARWSLAMPVRGGTLAGSGTLGGRLARPTWDVQVTEPAPLRLAGAIAWNRPSREWRLQARTDGMSLAAVRGDWPALRLSGEVSAQGRDLAFHAATDLLLEEPAFGNWRVRGELEVDEAWHLRHLVLTEPQGSGRIEAAGRWALAPGADIPIDAVALNLQAEGLTLPLGEDDPSLTIVRSKAFIEGSAGAYRLASDTTLRAAGLPPAEIGLKGRGDLRHIAFDTLTARWLGGDVRGDGQLAWTPELAWQASLRAEGLETGALASAWPGRLSFHADSRGSLPPSGVSAELQVDRIEGQLRGQALTGHVDAAIQGQALTLREAEIRAGQNRVTAAGLLAESIDLSLQVKAPRLATLHPAISGSLSAEARLSGAPDAPRVVLTADGSSLEYGDFALGGLDLTGDLDLSGRTPWRLRATGRSLKPPAGPTVQRATLRADGTAADHRIQLEVGADGLRLEAAASGGYRDGRWGGRLESSHLDGLPPGTWRHTAAAEVDIAPALFTLEPLCWRSGEARACLQASRPGGAGGSGELHLTHFPMAAANPFLPTPALQLGGRLSADARVDLASGAVDATVNGDGTELRYAGEAGELNLEFEQARLLLQGTEAGSHARVVLRAANDRADLEAELASPAAFPPSPDAPLRGEVSLSVADLTWVTLLTPDVVEPKGVVEGTLSVGGAVRRPELQGEIALSRGELFVIPAGIRLTGLSLSLEATGGDDLQLSGSAQSGPGRLSVAGDLTGGIEQWQLNAAITGERFEAVRLPSTRLLASPDLKIRVAPGDVSLEGTVGIPRAEIRIAELPRTARPSPDVVIVGERSPGPVRRWRTDTNVRLVLGDEVMLSGYGFTGRLTGALTITERSEKVPTGQGELNIRDGVYEAYGQKLTITEGRILYVDSPLANPGLDLRAVREIPDDEVTVGIRVTGPAQQPQISLFSEPSMEESNVLSYLVIGRPLSGDVSESEGSLLYRAALSLGFKGSGLLVEELGSRFGLEEVELKGGETPQAASLVLGTHLSPRLYLQYVVGFAQQVNSIRIRYDLGGPWTLEAESGEQSGTDLLYSIER